MKYSITKSGIFFVLAVGFLCGIFAASFFRMEKEIVLMIAAAAISIVVISGKKKTALVAMGALVFFALGIVVTNAAFFAAETKASAAMTEKSEFSAVVIEEPQVGDTSQKIIIRKNDGEKILLTADSSAKYFFGDTLKVRCELKTPKNSEDSRQGRGSLASLELWRSGPKAANFDYKMYLAKDNIYRVCFSSAVTVLGKSKENRGMVLLFSLKRKFEEKLSEIFPDPEGAYLKGLLLGGSKRMTKDMSDAFSKTGTSHAVAVSGYNVTIVAAFLMSAGIFLGLWRQQVFAFALLGILFFVLMTGAPASAVRAGIMGSLVIWAMKEGRLAHSTNAIMLAASAMLAVNPLLLRYDTGFQLSFLATLGIVHLSPIFEKFWKGRPPKIIRETIILTMAATIFVLPIILNSFEKLTLVSPIANFLILPAIPAIMGAGFAAGMAGFIFLPLGRLIGFLPYFLLKIQLWIVTILAGLSWSSIEVKNFGWFYVVVYYLLLGSFIIFSQKKRRLRPAVENGR